MSAENAIRLLSALAGIWSAIRRNHPEVPDVVLLPAPAQHGDSATLGHFAALRWQPRLKNGQRYHEVVVVAEHLNRGELDILETLLHEAAHALNFEAGIRDCSRSQYHNRSFKAAAERLGLIVAQVANYGFAATTLPIETATLYQEETEALKSVLIHRIHEPALLPTGPSVPTGDAPPPDSGGGGTSRSRKATCACPFIIRVSKSVIEATEIRCMTCGAPFRLAD